MTLAYYNEIDPFCAQWLRSLIEQDLIAPGVVDTRDIRDVRPIDLVPYTQHHFFAGIGGWSLALRRAAVPDDFPVWTGSCPCQPFSQAGLRRGFADERHLWPFWRYFIAVCRPQRVLGEQVARATDWLRLVRGDLEALGYAVGAIPVEAASAGADHLRDRFWFVAERAQQQQHGSGHAGPTGRDEHTNGGNNGVDQVDAARQRWREGRSEHELQCGRDTVAGASLASDLADADATRPQGRQLHPERTDQRIARPNGLAHPDLVIGRLGDFEPAGEQPQQHPQACNGFHMGNAQRARAGRYSSSTRPQEKSGGERLPDGNLGDTPVSPDYDWVIGADGKQRRVKSRLCVRSDGLPADMGGARPETQGEIVELVDFMGFLPFAETLARLEGDTATQSALYALRAACTRAWPLSASLPSLEEAWRCLPDEARQRAWGEAGAGRFVTTRLSLLCTNFPNRVGLLRGFGNAIDPRPAAAFIKAALNIA